MVINPYNGDMVVSDSSDGNIRVYHSTGHHRFNYTCPDGSADDVTVDKSGKGNPREPQLIMVILDIYAARNMNIKAVKLPKHENCLALFYQYPSITSGEGTIVSARKLKD